MTHVMGGEFAVAADRLLNVVLPDDGQQVLAADGYYSSGRAALYAILSITGGAACNFIAAVLSLCVCDADSAGCGLALPVLRCAA